MPKKQPSKTNWENIEKEFEMIWNGCFETVVSYKRALKASQILLKRKHEALIKELGEKLENWRRKNRSWIGKVSLTDKDYADLRKLDKTKILRQDTKAEERKALIKDLGKEIEGRIMMLIGLNEGVGRTTSEEYAKGWNAAVNRSEELFNDIKEILNRYL